MASPIQSPVASEILARAFNLTGRQSLALEDFVIPVVQIGEMDCGFAPALCRAASVRAVQAAVAGQFAVFRLVAPPGCVVELVEVVCNPSSAGMLEFDIEDTTTGATTEVTASKFYTDQRVRLGGPGPAQVPAAQVFRGTQAAGITGEYAIPIVTAGTVYRPNGDFILGRAPFPLAGAMGFFVETAVNEQAVLALRWREWFLV